MVICSLINIPPEGGRCAEQHVMENQSRNYDADPMMVQRKSLSLGDTLLGL